MDQAQLDLISLFSNIVLPSSADIRSDVFSQSRTEELISKFVFSSSTPFSRKIVKGYNTSDPPGYPQTPTGVHLQFIVQHIEALVCASLK